MEHLNPLYILEQFPWLTEKKQKAILSPDSDGLLCGLLMSHYFDWSIKGFYDGKILLLEQGVKAQDCIFMDVDIFRKDIRSIGHHMVLFNKKKSTDAWKDQYKNCLQPNNLRNFDFKNDFRSKYPLATIHLLLAVLNYAQSIEIPSSALCPLLFVDGTYQNLFNYPENVLNWVEFLNGSSPSNPMHYIFRNEHYTVHKLMLAMDDFFKMRDSICASRQLGRRERGDRLVISDKNGDPVNLSMSGEIAGIADDPKIRIEKFLSELSRLTGWKYDQRQWIWDHYIIYKFSKEIVKPLARNFKTMIEQNPLSYAITSGENLEFTLESPSHLP